MMRSVRWRSTFLAAAAFVLAFATDGAAQATGTIEGKVTEQGSGRPLAGAQVFIAGTTVGSVTNDRGEYRITSAPARQVEVRVRLIGYSPINRSVVVTAGQTSTLNVEVGVSALQLEQVVVTGTGAQVEVKKLGNTVSTIQPPAFAAISTPSQLLQARDAGVSILPASGLAGEGSRIRIRGNASLSMSNEPIVFVDGVRVNSGGGFGNNVDAGGGGAPSRLDDIDPASIERIEVLKGAAAATLYGTEASNGVIQIFTKKGSTGAARWTFNAEQAALDFPDRIKDNCGFTKTDTAATRLNSFFGQTVTPYQPFCINASDEILGVGRGSMVNGSVTGGTQGYTYFASARFADEDGPMDVDWLGPTVDKVRRIQGLTNMGLVPFNSLKLGLRLSYADALQQVPQNNNNIYGVTSLAMFAKPELANCDGSEAIAGTGRCTDEGNIYGNAAFMTVREATQTTTENRAGRFTGVFDATFTPAENISTTATLGVDATDDRSFLFRYFHHDVDGFTGNNVTGERAVDSRTNRQYTVDVKLNWRSMLMGLQSDFVAGVQGFIVKEQSTGGSNTNFPGPGLEVVGAGDAPDINEQFVQTVNGGYFFQDQLGFQEFLYLTVGGRYDYASAFGEEAGGVFYPKVSLSVVPSDRNSWTSPLGINTLRVRAAIGKSGRQPNAFSKFTTFEPLASELGAGLSPSNLGNPALAPEVSTEWEAGAELGFWDNRLGFDYTYWDRTVKDALIAKQFPLSGGFQNLQLANIGRLEAHGHDIKVNAFLVQRPNWGLDVFVSGAKIYQVIANMGGAAPLKVGGSYPRYRNFLKEGFAPGTLFGAALPGPCSARPAGATYTCLNPGDVPFDSNKDGIPDTEAEALAFLGSGCGSDTGCSLANLDPIRYDEDGNGDFLDHFLGKPYPDWNTTFGGNLNLGRAWRFNALFEYRGGNFTVTNLTDAFRNSHPTIGRNTLIAAQVEATVNNPASTAQERLDAARTWWTQLKALSPYDGLNQNEDGSFVRLREIGVAYTAPASLAAKLGARDATFSLTGRNLFLKTNYNGVDPETNAIGRDTGGGTDGNYLEAVDAFGWPLARRIAFAVRLGY